MKRRVLSKTISYIVQKKKEGIPKLCHFEQHYSLSSSLGEEESFVPLFSPTFLLSLSLSPLNIKKMPTIATCINSDSWPTTGQWKKQKGRAPLSVFCGCPCLSPLYFTYKYRGGEHKSTTKKKQERGQREKREEKGWTIAATPYTCDSQYLQVWKFWVASSIGRCCQIIF